MCRLNSFYCRPCHTAHVLRQTAKPHLKMHHVVASGIILATGIMGCCALNVLGLTGEFTVVLSTSGIVSLGAYVLVTSIVSCWLLFRVLVWKPSLEYLRPLCSAFIAFCLWSVDYSEYRTRTRSNGAKVLSLFALLPVERHARPHTGRVFELLFPLVVVVPWGVVLRKAS